MKLVVGLGNPGREYQATRHNVGFLVADLLAGRAKASWRVRGDRAEALAGDLLLVKPLAFMNLSGPPVREALGYRGASPTDCLVVCDDMALPLETIRLRARGSSGGHHGLDSIIAALGTSEFPRLRVGIGPAPPGVDGAAHVLGRFRPGEIPDLERAAEAAEAWAARGIGFAMTAYNAPRQRG